jgi:hypothetical protein
LSRRNFSRRLHAPLEENCGESDMSKTPGKSVFAIVESWATLSLPAEDAGVDLGKEDCDAILALLSGSGDLFVAKYSC